MLEKILKITSVIKSCKFTYQLEDCLIMIDNFKRDEKPKDERIIEGLTKYYIKKLNEIKRLPSKIIKHMEKELDFGDFVQIEQKRYGCDNEMYLHKVITRLKSNSYVDVPVQSPATETMHDSTIEVVSCICCGVSETEVLKYKVTDVKKNNI